MWATRQSITEQNALLQGLVSSGSGPRGASRSRDLDASCEPSQRDRLQTNPPCPALRGGGTRRGRPERRGAHGPVLPTHFLSTTFINRRRSHAAAITLPGVLVAPKRGNAGAAGVLQEPAALPAVTSLPGPAPTRQNQGKKLLKMCWHRSPSSTGFLPGGTARRGAAQRGTA